MQIRKNILKNDMKTYDFDVANSMNASSVESPPLNTAGPISVIVLITRSFLQQENESRHYRKRFVALKLRIPHPTDYQGVESIFEYLIIVKSLTSLGVRSVYSSFYR